MSFLIYAMRVLSLGWVTSSDGVDSVGCIIRCILHAEIGVCRCLCIIIAK